MGAAKRRGSLEFIGRNRFGVTVAKIAWNDGSEEIFVRPSSRETWDVVGELVHEGVLSDEHGFYA